MITLTTVIRCALSSKTELKDIARNELYSRYGNDYGNFLLSSVKKYPDTFFNVPEEFLSLMELIYKEKTGVLPFEAISELYHVCPYKKAAESELICKYEKFVYYIMEKYFPTYKDKFREDHFQCGCIGILNAMRNYKSGSSFTTYSQYYIRHEMMLFTHFVTNTPSRHYAGIQKKIKTATLECEISGLEATDQYLSILTGLSLRTIQQAKRFQKATDFLYLDSMEKPDMICECHALSPETELINQEYIKTISQSLLVLKPLTRKIILFHIFDNYSFPCIASHLNIPTWKVRDLYYDGLKKLRKDSQLHGIYLQLM